MTYTCDDQSNILYPTRENQTVKPFSDQPSLNLGDNLKTLLVEFFLGVRLAML